MPARKTCWASSRNVCEAGQRQALPEPLNDRLGIVSTAYSPRTRSEEDRRELILWAAACAERVLPVFESGCPGDNRPRAALEGACAFARGELRIRSCAEAGPGRPRGGQGGRHSGGHGCCEGLWPRHRRCPHGRPRAGCRAVRAEGRGPELRRRRGSCRRAGRRVAATPRSGTIPRLRVPRVRQPRVRQPGVRQS